MDILKDILSISRLSGKGSVVVIGNFDGVHKGHQDIIKRSKIIAHESSKNLSLLTFEPHPRELFRPDEPPFRITPEPIKTALLKECGVDILFSLPFDWNFASQSPEDFIQNILLEAVEPSHVIIGYDFRFGQLRKGTAEMLVDVGKEHGFEVTIIQKITDEQDAFSSTRIRTALRHGKIQEANALLGWDWMISGEVIKGDQRGRELGYPTANVSLGKTLHPLYGIYASQIQLSGEEEWRPSVTNIGIRPMFETAIAQMETHVFDFDQDIYGQIVKVRPVQHLRGEAKFDSLDALIKQMDKDSEQAKKVLK